MFLRNLLTCKCLCIEAARIPISARPPHSCAKNIGKLGDESLLRTQWINIREKLNGGEAQSMPKMDGGCAVSNATNEGFMRGRATRSRGVYVRGSNVFVGLK